MKPVPMPNPCLGSTSPPNTNFAAAPAKVQTEVREVAPWLLAEQLAMALVQIRMRLGGWRFGRPEQGWTRRHSIPSMHVPGRPGPSSRMHDHMRSSAKPSSTDIGFSLGIFV